MILTRQGGIIRSRRPIIRAPEAPLKHLNFEPTGNSWDSVAGDGIADSGVKFYEGSQSSQITFAPGANDYGILTPAAALPRWHLRWQFNAKTLTMADGDSFDLWRAIQAGSQSYLALRRNVNALQAFFRVVHGGAGVTVKTWTTVAQHLADTWVQFDLFVDGTLGAGSNVARCWFNRTGMAEQTALNAITSITGATFGSVSGIDPGTSGPAYIDIVDLYRTEHPPA